MSDPRIERALEEFFESERLSRRGFIGRAGSSGLALTGLAAVLAACGGVQGEAEKAKDDTADAAKTVSHPKTEIGNWTFANWPLYIDKKVLKDFNKQFGGKVKYTEEINDNFEFFGKVRQQLQNKQPIGRDIVTLTDYMAARWVRLGYSEPIDKKNVPNSTNLVDNLKTINYDPKREYTLPWQSGAIGHRLQHQEDRARAQATSRTCSTRSSRARSRCSPSPTTRRTTVLLGDGVDSSKATLDQLLGAIEKIDAENKKGQFRRFTGNDYTQPLAKGDIWVALAYSGDLVQLQSDNPDLRFSYFEEGNVLFTDNMMMPAKVEHPYAAETMMNYVYEPEVAATLAAYVNYISPVKGVKEVLEKQDPKLADEPADLPARRRRGEAATRTRRCRPRTSRRCRRRWRRSSGA